METKPVVGLDFKLTVSMDTVAGKYNLSNTQWEVEVFASSDKVVIFQKSQATKIDDNNYSVPVESAEIGEGRYYTILSVQIPDSDFLKGYRLESWQRYSGVTIYPKYDV